MPVPQITIAACGPRGLRPPPPPPCDIPSGFCFFTGPWTVPRSSLRMLRRVAAFCRPLRPGLLLVLFPHSRSPDGPMAFAPPPPPQRQPTREATARVPRAWLYDPGPKHGEREEVAGGSPKPSRP